MSGSYEEDRSVVWASENRMLTREKLWLLTESLTDWGEEGMA